jgi:DnaJ-class molecular chaperone
MKTNDFYGVLGVEHCATADDIKWAYRRLAHKYHPDVSDDPDGECKFKEVGEAYDTLKLPEQRSAYDRLLSRSPRIDVSQLGSQLSQGAWLGWVLWMYWWSTWECAWRATTDMSRQEGP